jgi:hypothetical protein
MKGEKRQRVKTSTSTAVHWGIREHQMIKAREREEGRAEKVEETREEDERREEKRNEGERGKSGETKRKERREKS